MRNRTAENCTTAARQRQAGDMTERAGQVERATNRAVPMRRGGVLRRALALGLMVAGAVLASGAHAPLAGAAPTDPSADKITVTHTGGVPVGGCITQFQLSYAIHRSGSMFQLAIVAPSRPCAPIAATAVIYAMPGKGSAWPQTLQQAVPFTISEAGTTTVTFTKDCTPAQFDVVTGATPDRITPFGGVMHGPLLFPGDINTAFQDVGAVCVDSSTTTAVQPTTTTTVVGATSVAGATTTVLPASTSATTTTTAKVLGTSSNRSSDPSSGVQDASLAATGTSSNSTALMGGLLVAAGCVALVVARRREDPQAHMITSAPSVSDRSPFGVD